MVTYGLDISQHNGNMDFKIVKAAGNDFVILRAGYGWSTDQKDPKFDEYYAQAKAAGLKVGAYWYSYARNVVEAQKEAECFLRVIAGKQFEMPVYIDMEDADGWKASNGNPSGAMQAKVANVFMQKVQDAGYYVGIYSSTSYFNGYLEGLSDQFTRWEANWGVNDGKDHGGVSAPVHQYTSVYTLGGKRYDRNVCRVDFAGVIKRSGLNGYSKPKRNAGFDVLNWVNKHQGAFMDPDGVYGYQCVDVFKQLLLDMGDKDGAKPLGGDGYAHQIWYKFNDLGYDSYFTKVSASDVKPGDVVVFRKGGDTPDSHVGVCVKQPSGGRIEVFGQNQGGPTVSGVAGSGCNTVSISTSSLLGGLRVKEKRLEQKPANYVYRLYNPNSGDHLYTKGYNEAATLVEHGWVSETGWVSPVDGKDVFRLYNGKLHTYAFKEEHDKLLKMGWSSEGVAFKSGGAKPVYRMYNPNGGSHVLTVDRKEHDALSHAGWYCEGQYFRGE